MTQVTIRQLTHRFSSYLKAVKKGERVVVLERHRPVADLVAHNENLADPGWKRSIEKIQIKGESFSKTISKLRDKER